MNDRMQHYVCAHCEARPPRGDYMVRKSVWKKVGMRPSSFLCLSCLETRLIAAGHGSLRLNDFTHVPCNEGIFFGYNIAVADMRRKRGVDA